MDQRHVQGRVQIISSSKAAAELIYSWPQSLQIESDDAIIILNFGILWHFMDDKTIASPLNLNLHSLEVLFDPWLSIPANFLLDKEVQEQSLRLLSNLLDQIWKNHLSMMVLRQFKAVLEKAAADIESKVIAGCLKLAVMKTSVQPEIFTFGRETRKVPSKHYSCAIMIIYRCKATSEDIENYYLMKNQAENQVFIP